MSTAAVMNGGGVASMAAGGLVATAQSIGATGALAATTYATTAAVDTAIGAGVAYCSANKNNC